MKSPRIPKKLPSAALTQSHFGSDEETAGLTFEGGQIAVQQAEHVAFHQVHFQSINLDHSALYSPQLNDVRLMSSSLANANCERLVARRVEFIECRLLGLNVTESHFQDVVFRDCDIQLAKFRFCTFRSVAFENCVLQNSNFQAADLQGVTFQRCDLSNAEMSQAKLTGTDFRTSIIEGLRVGPEEVVGAVVDHFQAAYMASLLGLVIKGEGEP